jgi:hypothetical protein
VLEVVKEEVEEVEKEVALGFSPEGGAVAISAF